jgi:serine/threonine-protein kinase
MTDWATVDALFSELLELEEAQRPARLDLLCGDDTQLRARLVHLLEAEATSRQAFELATDDVRSALADMAETASRKQVAAITAPGTLGPYRLTRLLGRGGMSSVWLAQRDDAQFEQRVAVKLLHHWLDEPQAVQRFLAERDILSRLSHPNIAQLFDGGTTADGIPWLATEYVQGQPLTSYCDGEKLGVRDRLRVFLQVTDAVQHAHQQLVVHRDLKPSNIMVDSAGRVRLLDFGIAKLLGLEDDPGRAPLTRTGHLPMTPDYAAPEQLTGQPITTATDVYQLGVVLYELLCGERPGKATAAGAAQAKPPRKPSTVIARREQAGNKSAAWVSARQLRGDIDVILLKALQEAPGQRYVSVTAMAEDLRHHLAGRAISARPSSLADTVRRFARRNPLGATALVLLAASLVAIIGVLQLGAARVAEERDMAVREARRASEATELLLGLFSGADPLAAQALSGRETTVWEVVEAATRRVRAQLHNDPLLRAEMLTTLATLHHYAGRAAEGASIMQEVKDLYAQHAGTESAEYAAALAELGRQWALAGRLEDARSAIDEALQIANGLPVEAGAARVSVLLDAGEFHRRSGSLALAEARYRQARAIIDGGASISVAVRLAVATGLADTLSALGYFGEAEAIARESVATVESQFGPDHARLVAPLATLGAAQRALGQPGAAAASITRGLDIARREYGDAYPSTLSLRNNLSLALAASGRPLEAASEMNLLVEQLRSTRGDDDLEVANALQNLGVMLALAGAGEEALKRLGEARAIYMRTLPAGSARAAFPLLTIAFIRLQRDEARLALQTAEQALQTLSTGLPQGHFATGIGQCLRGEALLNLGHTTEAGLALSAGLPLAAAGPQSLLPYLEHCQAAEVAVRSGANFQRLR